jgi:hypothetical protein
MYDVGFYVAFRKVPLRYDDRRVEGLAGGANSGA